ncbi:MAG: DUF5110 domain-containing protein [Bacteroidaceae bacterium]|nr:DUF5110 domain-containing protein [Bacteroidaceae bacterium]
MWYSKLFFIVCCLLTATQLQAAKKVTPKGETKVVNGVSIQATWYSDDIVRIVKYPGTGAAPEKKSYSVVLTPGRAANPNVQVRIDDATGLVTFLNNDGEVLLSETGAPMLDPRSDEVNKGKLRIAQRWQLQEDEDIYGLGQLRDEAMSWRGRDMELWNHNTYIAIPYITSSRGYGLYWDNAGKSRFTDNSEGMQFQSEVSPCIDYYFIYHDGTQDGVMAAVRQLSGQATMLPLWTMGHWQCRERYKTSDELAAVLDKYRQLQIPLDGIVQDWQYWGCDSNWNAMKFQNPYYINKVGDKAWERYLPDDLKKLAADYKAKGLEPRLKSPQEMVDYVHQNNAHLMISIWANFGSWTEPYKELQKIGALLPFDTWPRNKGVLPYDPFNPKARDIYWKYLSHLYQMGFDAWWTDSTEPDHFEETAETDAHQTYDGSWLSVKNAFPLMSNRGIYEHQRAMKGNKKRSIQMTRSGSFGIQRYATFSWSGDIKASWQEMKNQVPSGLNYTLCGIPYWNTDLGGFFYWDYEQSPRNPAVQELQTRWMQWGTFMPLMRNHCSSPMVSEIYEFGQKGDWAYDAMVDAVKLRYRLLPYIYSMMGEVVQHSGMMMRPLVMDFANDVKARRLNDEYMFGHALLVKPITDPMYTWKDDQKRGHEIYPDIRQAKAPVSVYLPTSIWYDFFTGERYEGGRTILRPTPITDMPVYVRAGSIIPFGPDVQYSDEKNWQELEIRVYPGADGTFTLYEDEGDGYNYERGAFTEIPFTWDDSTRTLTIGPRKGSYKGMLRERRFTIIVAGHTSSQPQTVSYSGEAISINL